MASYDFVSADKFEKMVGPFFAPCLRIWPFLGLFWARFGHLVKSRSGNPALALVVAKGKSSQELFRQHTLILTQWYSHCFVLIFFLDDLFAVSWRHQDLDQVPFDLVDRFHICSVKTQLQRQLLQQLGHGSIGYYNR